MYRTNERDMSQRKPGALEATHIILPLALHNVCMNSTSAYCLHPQRISHTH